MTTETTNTPRLRTRNKRVRGVGVNDSDYPVYTHIRVNGKDSISWVCPFYRTWSDMMQRCYSSTQTARHPTYTGCTVAPEWHSFMSFRAWMIKQAWEGNQLDKDVLITGNRVYSPATSVFVSRAVNMFLVDSGAIRGDWPVGVCLHKPAGKFQASCCNPLTKERGYIGIFDTPEEAHEAWRARKHQYACALADLQTDPRVSTALRTRYAHEYY